MYFGEKIINESVYGTISYIDSWERLELLEQYILYNLPMLERFKQIVIATNYKEYPSLVQENTDLWKKYFPDCIIINSKLNRGHNFGTADLDNLIINYCKNNNIKWLCKTSSDVILDKEIFKMQVEPADFYYLNGIGYGGMFKYGFDFDKIVKNDFYPQTNFYCIRVDKIDYLIRNEYLEETYNYVENIPDYNGKIWEYIEGWSCEYFLRDCIIRNKLKTYHLISNSDYYKLLKFVYNNQIHDCSHKNISISGVCHFHYPTEIIAKI